ncbi:hypothetical protein D3C74_263320 [compost metagenome]
MLRGIAIALNRVNIHCWLVLPQRISDWSTLCTFVAKLFRHAKPDEVSALKTLMIAPTSYWMKARSKGRPVYVRAHLNVPVGLPFMA